MNRIYFSLARKDVEYFPGSSRQQGAGQQGEQNQPKYRSQQHDYIFLKSLKDIHKLSAKSNLSVDFS
jgi:hypothetical protein